jgi:hypothetical protein
MNRSISAVAASVVLALTAPTGFASEHAQDRAIPRAAPSADLLARADRALRDYVTASSTGDSEALGRLFTNDAVIEYALEEPGTYLAVAAAALSANRAGNAQQTGPGAHISNLQIFPTPDSNTVFVHYTTSADVQTPEEVPASEHLALLEMRGDRIFKMRKLGANAGNLSTLEASVVTRAITRSRVNAND